MNNELKSIIDNFTLVTQIGLVVVICLTIGLGLGIMADKWVNNQFIFKLTGIIVGLAAGIYQAYRMVIKKIQ